MLANHSIPNSFTKVICTFLLSIAVTSMAYAQQSREEWLKKLQEEISRASVYDAEKKETIRLLTSKNYQPDSAFAHFQRLYDEYALFHFDSAYYYARAMQQAAILLNDSLKSKWSSVQLSTVLLSSGMFKELFESVTKLNPAGLTESQKAEYFSLMARSYFDLADFNRDSSFAPAYNKLAEVYIDSCLIYSDTAGFRYLYFKGLQHIRAGDVWGATHFFRRLQEKPSLTLHEQAIVYSTFSDIYIRRGMPDSAIILLVKAAIADIHFSTKETTAILHLSSLLFRQGDISHASAFVQKAALDAKTYGARQRMIQLSSVLPIIEAERMALLQKEKSGIMQYASVVTISLLVLGVLIFTVVKQVRKLKKQQQEIYGKNISLERLVDEKQWLLREVHHRVKNNLHTITSLLESQSAYLQADALQALRVSQHRIFAMSLIHQKLYQPELNESRIDMSVYIREMVKYLEESFESTGRIEFMLELEPLYVDISVAVPMGLILNEAVTNALKYAFPGQQKGLIKVSLKRVNGSRFSFSVSDNGTGLPSSFSLENVPSLGMKLMKGLSADLGAGFFLDGKQGTTVSVDFSADKNIAPHPDLR